MLLSYPILISSICISSISNGFQLVVIVYNSRLKCTVVGKNKTTYHLKVTNGSHGDFLMETGNMRQCLVVATNL